MPPPSPLPEVLADGRAFPQRNLIVFLTFCVIFVTLVLQGVTLPPLIRASDSPGPPGRTAKNGRPADRDRSRGLPSEAAKLRDAEESAPMTI